MGKTFTLPMGRREVVCNICSHALEFWVRRLPLANGQESSGLHHLELCTGVWVGKTPPLLTGREKLFATSGVMHLSLGG